MVDVLAHPDAVPPASSSDGRQDSTTSDGDETDTQDAKASPSSPPSSSPSWAQHEGERRIRAKKVLRDMQFLTSMAAIGGFLFGYDTGVISGAMLPLARAFDLTAGQKEVVVSSTVFAALVASLAGGSLNDNLGRRKCCLIASSVFTLGSVVLLLCWDYPSLVVGRIIVGLGTYKNVMVMVESTVCCWNQIALQFNAVHF